LTHVKNRAAPVRHDRVADARENQMPFIRKPVLDQWYRHLDKGGRFRVIAIDDTARTVEVQDFDGDVEEIDLDNWYVMDIEAIAPPEDLTGPMDDIERDDLGYTDTGTEDGGSSEWSPERLARREEVEEEETQGEAENGEAVR
jgi:hypothetical protein